MWTICGLISAMCSEESSSFKLAFICEINFRGSIPMHRVLVYTDFIFKTKMTSELPQHLYTVLSLQWTYLTYKEGQEREVKMTEVRCFYLAFLIMDFKLKYFGSNIRNTRICYGPICLPHVPCFLAMMVASDGAELVKYLISFQRGER